MADQTLQALFLFADVPEALETLLLPKACTFEKGAVIYGGETFQRALGVILAGKAEAAAQRCALREFTVGSVFGAAALFGGNEYVSTIRAVTRCSVQFIPEETLRALFAAYPQTAVNYITFLSGRIRFLNGKIATFTDEGAANKLYRYLCINRGSSTPSMTKLAASLGIGRTSLYRALDELEQRRLIHRNNGKPEII